MNIFKLIYSLSKFILSKSFFIVLILFVCTKRQFRVLVQNAAIKTNSHYITYRWLGGLLTNWLTVKACIEKLKLLFVFDLKFLFQYLFC